MDATPSSDMCIFNIRFFPSNLYLVSTWNSTGRYLRPLALAAGGEHTLATRLSLEMGLRKDSIAVQRQSRSLGCKGALQKSRGLSRFYSSKSQSFTNLADCLQTEHGESALALQKPVSWHGTPRDCLLEEIDEVVMNLRDSRIAA